MHCDRCQELVSARLDGETTPLEDEATERHLARCGPCASQAAAIRRAPAASSASRASRPPLPASVDLTVRVLDRLAWSPGSEVPDWARYGLLAVALTQVVLAVPSLLAGGKGLFVHDLHHLGSWELAFGIGLVVVAWQPERARGLLPMAAALAFGMAVTAAFDVFDRTIPITDEAHHLFDFVGVFLLWVVGRSFRIRPTRRQARRADRDSDAPVAGIVPLHGPVAAPEDPAPRPDGVARRPRQTA